MKKDHHNKSLAIRSLERFCLRHPRDEKVLIAPSFQAGRQMLEDLARAGTSWINFRAATIFSLAQETIEADASDILTEAGSIAIVDKVFAELADTKKLKYFRKHSINKGIVEALSGTIKELKSLRLFPEDLKAHYFVDKKKADDIKAIYSKYIQALKDKGLLDSSDVISKAIDLLNGKANLPQRKYMITRDCYARGTKREFIEKLCGESMAVVSEEQVEGLAAPQDSWAGQSSKEQGECSSDIERMRYIFNIKDAPKPFDDGSVDLFSAAGSRNEICEVMRRIASGGLPADDVELIYTDYKDYVNSIYAFCERAGIHVTFSEGLPGYFCAPGRALTGFLMWIQDQYNEIYLRRMLKGGDLCVEKICGQSDADGSDLAFLLRTSGVGWDRDRYGHVLSKREREYSRKSVFAKNEGDEKNAERSEKSAEGFKLLREICRGLLELVPKEDSQGNIDLAELCDGCVRLLSGFVRISDDRDQGYAAAAAGQMQMLSGLVEGRMPPRDAIDRLLLMLSRVRCDSSPPKPGHLYVSNYKSGGRAGRKNIFIVGMDELKFPGSGMQDPVLLDEERRRAGKGLELSSEKMKKNLYDMVSLLSRLRGKLTVSFSAYDVKDDRNIFPSSFMLQVLRVKEGRPEADYSYLSKALNELVCFNTGSASDRHVDEIGWWLDKLSGPEMLKNGRDALMKCYPGIENGINAKKERQSSRFTVYDGKVEPEGDELDPRNKPDVVLSCSRLEAFSRCPFAYFLEYVLEARRPEETEKDPASWLDSLQRGSLLHEVYQKFAEAMMNEKEPPDTDRQKKVLYAILKDIVEKYAEEIPPPGKAVFEYERDQLKADMEVFLRVNKDLNEPAYVEMEFGLKGKVPASIPLGDGSKILLKGKIDRVDRSGEHEYSVWDYKTGSAYSYNPNDYVVGGRQIQHALYAKAAEQILRETDSKAKVKVAGYVLPTEKGEMSGKGNVFRRDPSRDKDWQKAVSIILDLISNGIFLLPEEKDIPSYLDDEDIYGDKARKDQSKVKIKDASNVELNSWRTLRECK